MIGMLWDACVLLWILAHEKEDPDDGEERIYTSSVACGDTFLSRGRLEEKEAVA